MPKLCGFYTKMLALQIFKVGTMQFRQVSQIYRIGDPMSDVRGRTKSEADKIAAEIGLVPFYAKDNELLIDLDEPHATAVMRMSSFLSTHASVRVLRNYDVNITHQLYTKSNGGNAHLYLNLDTALSTEERMVLQAVFRSDPTREVYNLFRTKYFAYQIALFETPDQAELVKKWRKDIFLSDCKKKIERAKFSYT